MLKKISCFLCACLVVITPVLTLNAVETSYVTPLNDAQFEQFIQKADKPIIVDFWAPWCAPCMAMKPIFDQMADELNEHYLFASVNIDEAGQIAQKYGVTSIPTFKVIKNNTVIGTFGSTTKEGFKDHVNNAIHHKFTHNTLLSAIQANDKELIAACLAHQDDVDVNAIIQMPVMNTSVPMTPLLMAISMDLATGQSHDIVSMLLNAGAQIDLEVDSVEFDSSLTVIGRKKETARSMLEGIMKGPPAEFMTMDAAIQQKICEMQARAATLLKLFQSKQDSLPISCQIPKTVQ